MMGPTHEADGSSYSNYDSAFERRISELEAILVGQRVNNEKNNHPLLASGMDISTSIARLVDTIKTKIPLSTHADMQEIQRLERDLHPGLYLTCQTSGVAKSSSSTTQEYSKPLMYQREEILACAKQFQTSMDQLDKIKELLSLSVSSGSSSSREDPYDYNNAPIVASDRYSFSLDTQVQERIDKVSQKVVSLLQRADAAAYRVDSLVGRYQTIISASSEKVVLIDEELHRRQRSN